jgi:hypothetical protein
VLTVPFTRREDWYSRPPGIAAEMKPDHNDRLEAGGDLGSPREFSLERLRPQRLSGRSTIRRSKRCVVPGGALSIASAVCLCS